MNMILNVLQHIIDLGATAILPITLLFIGLIFGLGPAKSFKAGVTVGVGFIGINLVIGLLMGSLGAAAQAMVGRIGLNLTVIDGGWASGAAAAWGSPVALVLLLVCIVVNLVMVALKFTKTLDVDIWNYWHLMFVGSIGYVVTGNIAVAIALMVIIEIAVFIMSDRLKPLVSGYFEIEGVSLPTCSSLMWLPLGIPINWLLSKIPGIKNINFNSENIQKRFGIFGEPLIIGLILGCVIGILAGYGPGQVWLLGVTMGAAMFLMPRMIKILLEGILPVSEAAQETMRKRFKNREIYIGLDSAIALGDPAVLSTSLVLVPIMVILAAVLPGNKLLPFGDLASMPFYVAFIVAHNKGNIFRSLISGTILIALTLYLATNFAPVYTDMMKMASYQIPEGAAQMSSFTSGGSILNWVPMKLAELFNLIVK